CSPVATRPPTALLRRLALLWVALLLEAALLRLLEAVLRGLRNNPHMLRRQLQTLTLTAVLRIELTQTLLPNNDHPLPLLKRIRQHLSGPLPHGHLPPGSAVVLPRPVVVASVVLRQGEVEHGLAVAGELQFGVGDIANHCDVSH